MTQSESGGGSGCVRTSKGPQNPSQGFIRACQLFNWTFLDRIYCINFIISLAILDTSYLNMHFFGTHTCFCRLQNCPSADFRLRWIDRIIKKMHFIILAWLCIKHESTNRGHYFYISYWRRDRHFTWSSEPREGLAACSAKGVPSFLWILVRPPGNEPVTSRSAVTCSTDWANTRVVSKTKHSKTKTEARSTQISKTKHPKLENEAATNSKTKTPRSKTKHPKLENVVKRGVRVIGASLPLGFQPRFRPFVLLLTRTWIRQN